MKNLYNCDSTITLYLTVLPHTTTIDALICAGESIAFGDSSYSSTGIYKDTLTNQLGCDSISVLNLTVNAVDSVELAEIICEGEAVNVGSSTYSETESLLRSSLINMVATVWLH